MKLTIALVAALAAGVTHAQLDQKPLTGEEPRPEERYPEKPARLSLSRDPVHPCHSKVKSKIDVPVNTCLSANFTLDGNVGLLYPGSCAGSGRSPYVALFPSADCIGPHAHPTWYDRPRGFGPGYCLGKAVWGEKAQTGEIEPAEDQWSMLFRCGEPEPADVGTLPVGLPVPPPPPKPKPRPSAASISDSACWVKGVSGAASFPRLLFRTTEADNCLDTAPGHSLKVFRNALCANGTEALLARFDGRGCRGEPSSLGEVRPDMIDTCLDVASDDAAPGSYAFWCAGDLRRKPAQETLFEDGRGGVHYTNRPGRDRDRDSAAAVGRAGACGLAVGCVAVVMGLLMS
jgi:hypothetical protein